MICVVLLTGCSTKFSSDDFKSAMSGIGLTAKEGVPYYDGCSEQLTAKSKHVTFNYYKFDIYNGSTACYSSERMDVGILEPEDKDEAYISGGQKYTASTGGKYYRIVRKGSVVMTAVGRAEDKSSIDKLFADVGMD